MPGPTPRSRWTRALAGVLAAALLVSCTDTPTEPVQRPGATGKLLVYANVGATSITTLVIRVSGPGIVKADGTTPDTLAFNIERSGAVATGTIVVPAGPARVITAEAYDGVVVTHRGTTTANIAEGTNPTVTVTLVPLVGDVPISVSVGTTIVIVRPAVATVAIGQTQQLEAEIRDNNGGLVNEPVRWATLNPGKATVTSTGLVTVRDTGEVQIVATYGTVGGSSRITGTVRLSDVPYELEWNGSVNTNWFEPNNWTPKGIGAARVPTLSDSVVIKPGAPRWPRLETCGQGSVKDLLIEAGAQLDVYCGNVGVNVYGTAVVRGSIAIPVYLRPGATVAGTFQGIYVLGDTTRLAENVQASFVEVNAAGASLGLAGHKLTVNGDFNVYSGTARLAGTDTLVANGNVYWSGADHTGKITGGVVLFRGNDFNGTRYKATGTNRLVFDRPSGAQQSISGFDFLNAPDRAVLQQWEVRSPVGVRICAHVAITDTVSFATGSTPAVVDNGGCGGYYARVGGPLISDANTQIQSYLWDLRHPTGTSLVAGSWSPQFTDFHAADGIVKPGLGYRNLRFYAPNHLLGTTSAAGHVLLSGAGTELRIDGDTLTVGDYLQVSSGAVLAMLNGADRVLVANYASFDWDGSSAHAARDTAGLLRVGSYLYAYGFGSTGSHRVELTGGSTAGGQYINGTDFSRPGNDLRNLEITGGNYSLCGQVRVRGTFALRNAAAFNAGNCGGYQLHVYGDLVTEVGTTFSNYLVALFNPSGTANVAGAWSPQHTDFHVSAQPIRATPNLAYQRLRFFGGTHQLAASTTASIGVWVEGAGVDLNLNGQRLEALGAPGSFSEPGLVLRSGGTVTMQNAADTVVARYMDVNSAGPLGARLTNGAIKLAGDLHGQNLASSGSHAVILTGTRQRVYNMNYLSRPTQQLANLIVDADTVDNCSHVDVTGTLDVRRGLLWSCGGATNSDWYLNVRGDLQVAEGARVQTYRFILSNPTGTQNVQAGAVFSPLVTHVNFDFTGTQLKPGLGYQHMAFDRSAVLSGNLTVNGNLDVNNTGTNLTLAGHRLIVNGALDLNTNASIVMTNPADSLEVNGDVNWDGGASHAGKLTTGTVIMRGARWSMCNYAGSGDNLVVFDRSAADPVRIECVNGSSPTNMPLQNVEVRGRGVTLNCYMYAAGNVHVMEGSRLTANCGSSLWVEDTLFVDAGADVANGASWASNGSQALSVVLYDRAGTGRVQGSYNAAATYFLATDAEIKPDLDYKYVRIDQSTAFRGPTEIDGQLDIIGNAVVNLGGNTVMVGGTLNFDTGGRLRMNSPNDTMVVAFRDPNAHLFWDGGDNGNSGVPGDELLTAGAIKFYGQRFVGTEYRPAVGSEHTFIFAGSTAASAVSVEGMNPGPTNTNFFNRVRVTGPRTINLVSRTRVNDTLNVMAPALITGTSYLHLVAGGGGLVMGPGSDMAVVDVYLDDPSGTRDVSTSPDRGAPAIFRPSRTFFRSLTPAADAIQPGLGYNSISIEGPYQLSAPLALPGHLDVAGSNAVFTPGGNHVQVGGHVEVFSGGALALTNESDSLGVNDYFRIQANAGFSDLSQGVLAVGGDFTLDHDLNGATGPYVRLDGAGTTVQNVNTGNASGTPGSRGLRLLEIVGSRPVQTTRQTLVAGPLYVSSPVAVTFASSMQIDGQLQSVAGSAISARSILDLNYGEGTGTAGIAGSFSSISTTRFNASFNQIKGGAGMTYGNVELNGHGTTQDGPLSLTGYLVLGSAGQWGGNAASLTLPTGSTIGNYVETFGDLSFAGSATTAFDLHVRAGGRAIAQGTGSTDCVDFRIINVNSASSPRPAGVLDNSVVGRGGCGFRIAPTGSFNLGTGATLSGPTPTTHP